MKSDLVNNSRRVDLNVIISDNLRIYGTRYINMFTKKYTAIKDSQFSIDTINVHYITFCYCNCRDRVYIRNIHRNVFFRQCIPLSLEMDIL